MRGRYLNKNGGTQTIDSYLNRIHCGRTLGFFVSLCLVLVLSAPMPVAALPDGFQETTVFSDLSQPIAARFAPDGRIFVAEKSGIIKVFDNLSDSTPDIFADLRTNVYNGRDRGLLGLAIHPDFPNTPYIYVLYTFDADVGGVRRPNGATPVRTLPAIPVTAARSAAVCPAWKWISQRTR